MKRDLQYFLDLLSTAKITSISEFRKTYPADYLYYCRNRSKIGELPLTRTKQANGFHTLSSCKELAAKYAHKLEFKKNEPGAYFRASKNGWLDSICAHMTKKVIKKSPTGTPAHNRKDLTGQKFGKWTALRKAGVGRQFGWVCVCECGYEGEVKTGNLTLGLSKKCPKCSNQISKPSVELFEYVKSLGFSPVLSYRDFGFELDIYVPEKNFFIEYDGLLWHSSKFRATEASEKKRRDKILAVGNGIRIFEDQYKKNPELVRQMIANRLGIRPKLWPASVGFSICKTPSIFKEFCEQYHLDGYGRSSWAVVAFDGDLPIAFMGFRPYMSGAYKGEQELSRFCTNYNVNCYGLFSKMLKLAKKHIKQQNTAKVIVSASDNCISVGGVYKNNGFSLVQQRDQLNWYYYLHSKGLRLHRARGKRLKPPKITKEEFTQYPTESLQASSGFMALKRFGKFEPMYKIYGWGQKLWLLKL